MWLQLWIYGTIDTFFVLISLQEPLIVYTGHIDVDIIVPRDVPLMTYSTYQRATRQKVTNAMSLAKAVHIIQNAHLNAAEFMYVSNLFHHANYSRPNSHFLNIGLMRRMFDVTMQKPITSIPMKMESVVSMTKLWGNDLKKSPIAGNSGMKKKWMR